MKGFTLLECLIALAIISLLSFMGMGYWDGMIANRAVKQDASRLVNAFRAAQMRAMAGHQPVQLCGDPTCTEPWDRVLFMLQGASQEWIYLSGKTRLDIRTFPAHKPYQFTFTPHGMTDFQNASIEVCSLSKAVCRQVKINQAGRARLGR